MRLDTRSSFFLLPFITVASFALTWISSYRDFSAYDLGYILGLTLLTLAIQLLLMLLTLKLSRHALVANLLFSIFVLFNVYSLHLSFINRFINLDVYIQGGLALVGLFIFYTLQEIASNSKYGAIAIYSVVTATLLINASPLLYESITADGAGNTDPQKITSNLNFVEFQEKPNVYIVMFDALMPEALLKSHLNLEQVPYSIFLKENFHSFQNMFADDVPTRQSLGSLLGFDRNHYQKTMSNKQREDLFSGGALSPLTELFKRNGYTISTLFANNYFGNSKGPYVDNYFIGNLFTLCDFIDSKVRSIAFFGFCSFQDTRYWKKNTSSTKLPEYLVNNIIQRNQTGTPQFFLAYIYSPGHTKKDYRSDNEEDVSEYRERYYKRSNKTVNILNALKELVDGTSGNDILIVMGDHGPYLSRTVELSDNPRFYVQDRYGIYGGVYPKDKCIDDFKRVGEGGYRTPVMVLEGLVLCLSGGDSPFRIPQSIVGPLGKPANITYQGFKYE